MSKRLGEDAKTWFRTDRFYSSNCQWFFATREHGDFGPFESKAVAEVELIFYLREQGYISETADFVSLEQALASNF